MTAREDDATWHAVVDIGSNSVRLVVYTVAGRAMLPHYNERVMAGLGKGLRETGKLSEAGTEKALRALGRFRAILKGLSVQSIRAVATAAARSAADGPAFLAKAQYALGAPIDVVSGKQEAQLAALGVIGGFHDADGVIGDLGGSSLEFARIGGGEVIDRESHMLGPLAMMQSDEPLAKLSKRIEKALADSPVLKSGGGRFFMVGGAWRALAKFHMDIVDYPLRQLHAYRLDSHAIALIREACQSPDAFVRQRLAKASQRRLDVLPYAGLVLSTAFEMGRFSEAVVSSHGLREGVILSGLSEDQVRDDDPLLDGVTLYQRLEPERLAFGRALFDWLLPVMRPGRDLFDTPLIDPRILAAACLLADSGARFHPDNRAEMAYEHALRGPFSSITIRSGPLSHLPSDIAMRAGLRGHKLWPRC